MNINDNMKTLKNIFAFLMLLPVMASCHFLEVEKTGKTSIKNFYSDVYALDAAVNGIYGMGLRTSSMTTIWSCIRKWPAT